MSNTLTRNYFVATDGKVSTAYYKNGVWSIFDNSPIQSGSFLVTLQMWEDEKCHPEYSLADFQKNSSVTVSESENAGFKQVTILLKDPIQNPAYLGFLLAQELPKYVEDEVQLFYTLDLVGDIAGWFHDFGHRD